MIKLFIDTNVVIDTMDHARTPEWKCSEDVINLSAFKDYFRLCISMKSIADISYLGCKLVGKERIKPVLKQLMNDCKIIPLEEIMLYECLKSTCPDFEDAMQISCADLGDCDCIITNNTRHFRGFAPMPVFTPEEFLAE